MAADKYRPHNPLEYAKLMEWARGCDSVLEIGSRYGHTLRDFAFEMGAGRIVSVDLPGAGQWGESDSEQSLRENVAKLLVDRYDAHLFIGDSKDPAIIEQVRALGPFDFIFIDGDHTFEGVSADWQNYGWMGKRVVFHDIVKPGEGQNQNLQVWRLWNQLSQPYAARETEAFIAPGSLMGIGRVG